MADSHPEVAQRVEPMGPSKTPLFHSKYHYQKVVVHRMQASRGETFHVLYLTTGEGPPQDLLACLVKMDMKGIKNNITNIWLDLYTWKEELIDRELSRDSMCSYGRVRLGGLLGGGGGRGKRRGYPRMGEEQA